MSRVRSWRAFSLFATLAVLAAIITSCGDDGGTGSSAAATDGTNETAAPSGEPVSGGTVTWVTYTETASMDPISITASSGTGGPRFAAVYGALVTFLAEKADIEPWLAESLEPNADFTQWTLKLRPGLEFSDGTPFDADAVKTNWARAQDPGSRSPSYSFAIAITDMEVVDDLTLVATLEDPNAQFGVRLSREGVNYIVSPEAIAQGTVAEQPVGAGPFVMDRWVRDDQMTFKRNPSYFDAPRPYLDGMTVRVIPDDEQRIDTYATGGVDGFYSNITGSLERGAKDGGGAKYSVLVPDAIPLMPNNSVAPFDDVRMRKMLALAVDRDAVTETVSPGSLPAHNFTLEDSVWFTPDAELPAYDPDEAQRLIDEYIAENGGPIKISMLASSSNTGHSTYVQTSLMQLDGLEVSLDVMDSPTFIGRIRSGEYHLVPWGLPWLDPDVSIATFVGTGLSTNYSKYSNSKVDALIDKSSNTSDLDERVDLYSEVFAILADELPVVPLWHGEFGWVFNEEIHDVALYEDGIPRWDLVWRDS